MVEDSINLWEQIETVRESLLAKPEEEVVITTDLNLEEQIKGKEVITVVEVEVSLQLMREPNLQETDLASEEMKIAVLEETKARPVWRKKWGLLVLSMRYIQEPDMVRNRNQEEILNHQDLIEEDLTASKGSILKECLSIDK